MLDGDQLRCGACGESCGLHHDMVEIFERHEDAQAGLYVRVENGEIKKGTDLRGNPSARRHGLLVTFWCELCGRRSRLSIAQHKGVELVSLYEIPTAPSQHGDAIAAQPKQDHQDA